MHILSIASQKGGVGKTTLAWNLAIASAMSGNKTIVLDVDPQASCTEMAERREANGYKPGPRCLSVQAKRLPNELHVAIEEGCDLAIIDTPPNIGREAFHISECGTLTLIPTQPSMLDLSAIKASIEIARLAKRPSTVVMTMCPPVGKVGQGVGDQVEEAFETSVCPIIISRRVAFVKAADPGLGVIELEPDGRAAQEINLLWDWIQKALAVIEKPEAEESTKPKSVA